jgi:hypothetical protein
MVESRFFVEVEGQEASKRSDAASSVTQLQDQDAGRRQSATASCHTEFTYKVQARLPLGMAGVATK